VRTTQTLSISISPAQLRQAERLARKEHRTMSELVREALRRYQEQKSGEDVGNTLLAALRALQQDARSKGTSRLTRRQVTAEIRSARRDRASRRPAQ